MASSLSFAILVISACLFALTHSQMMGVTSGEVEVCENYATENGKVLEEAVKDRRLSCNIVCKFEDGTQETLKSPDGQSCCDVGGGMPTGTCKDGKCPVGGGIFG